MALARHGDTSRSHQSSHWRPVPAPFVAELNINSAIAYPGHLEVVPLTGGSQKYTVQGYCYTGGGRKVIRVELSTDGGKTWTLTKLKRHEEPTEYGRYWCWVFWEWEIDLSTLFIQPNGAELLCRGWDAAMNRQPEAITWNVMGMMNNSYFRIKARRPYAPRRTHPPAACHPEPTPRAPAVEGASRRGSVR